VGKLRMGLDLILPRGPRSRGRVDRLVRAAPTGPRGAREAGRADHGGHPRSRRRTSCSLKSTFPRFADLEREHRSLIKALRPDPAVAGNLSPFLSLRGGMSELGREADVDADLDDVRHGRRGRPRRPAKVRLSDRELDADHVILAIPAPAAKRLWPDAPEVRYVTTSTVSLC